jgi:hypothetical protein
MAGKDNTKIKSGVVTCYLTLQCPADRFLLRENSRFYRGLWAAVDLLSRILRKATKPFELYLALLTSRQSYLSSKLDLLPLFSQK